MLSCAGLGGLSSSTATNRFHLGASFWRPWNRSVLLIVCVLSIGLLLIWWWTQHKLLLEVVHLWILRRSLGRRNPVMRSVLVMGWTGTSPRSRRNFLGILGSRCCRLSWWYQNARLGPCRRLQTIKSSMRHSSQIFLRWRGLHLMLLFLLLVNHLEIEMIILDDLFPVILLLQKHLTMFCRRSSSILVGRCLTCPPKIGLILGWLGSFLNRFARGNWNHLVLSNFGSLRIERGSLLCRVIFDWSLIYLLLVLLDMQT